MDKKLLLKKIFIIISIFLLIYSIFKVSLFYIPFVIAFIISILLNPIINKITDKFSITRKVSSIIVLFSFFIITSLFLGLAVTKIIEESSFFSRTINIYVEKINEFILNLNNNKFISEKLFISENVSNILQRNINEYINTFAEFIKDKVTEFISNLKIIPIYFVNIIITVLAIYFLLADKFSLLDKLEFQFSRKLISKIRYKLEKISRSLINYIKAEVILILIDFILILVGLYILKLVGMNVKYPFLMAILIGFVDALPILGAGIVMVPWSIILFINKDTALGFSILGLFILVLCIKQMIEPKLVSSKIGVHPLFTLIAMYTGFKINGFIGLLLGPIILIILKEIFNNFLDKGFINYLKEE